MPPATPSTPEISSRTGDQQQDLAAAERVKRPREVEVRGGGEDGTNREDSEEPREQQEGTREPHGRGGNPATRWV